MDEQDTTTPKITRPELSRRGFIQLGAAAAAGVSLAATTAPASATASQRTLASDPMPRSVGPPSRQPAATLASAPPTSPLDPLTADETNTVFRVVKAHEQFPQGAFPWLWSPITASALVLPGGAPKPLRPPDRRRRRHG